MEINYIINEFGSLKFEMEGNSLTFNSCIKLPGEVITYKQQWDDSIVELTNYRLFFSNGSRNFDIPLGRIDSFEVNGTSNLLILPKERSSQRHKCELESVEMCQDLLKELNQLNLNPVSSPFAFDFYSACQADPDKYREYMSHLKSTTKSWSVEEEFKRMKFDPEVWGIFKCNSDYKLCNSYPQELILPAGISEKDLEAVASFRHSRRIPTVVWRHQATGTVIARCSQPSVSWLGNRSVYDEMLVQKILDACITNCGGESIRQPQEECYSIKSESSDDPEGSLISNGRTDILEPLQKLLIIDARAYTAAIANRVRGGGMEYEAYYNCNIEFMNMPNIHAVRHSFQSLRTLCSLPVNPTRWLSQLESTNWLQYLSGIMKAAMVVIDAVDIDRRPVLVHCSDGWDRTPQIIALAEICLDPFYRTKKGFQILVEREWINFGHKFADRYGLYNGSTEPNERCPIFLQFLDCMFQLLNQYPCSFEFNSQFLESLAHHVHSGLFGNFFCNTSNEREKLVHNKSFCLWSYLHSSPPEFYTNFLYIKLDEVLRPKYQVNDLILWNNMYTPSESVPIPNTSIINVALSRLEANSYYQEPEEKTVEIVNQLSTDNASSELSQNHREWRSNPIEASTDTLIDEPICEESNDGSIQKSVSISTSTSDLSSYYGDTESIDSSIPPKTLVLPCNGNGIPHLNGTSKSSETSFSSTYSTPHHSRTPSSGFPATPNDETPLPSPWPTLKGSANISPDKVQARLQQIFIQFEIERVSLQKELGCKHCCSCKNKNIRPSYPTTSLENPYGITDEGFEYLSLEECSGICSNHQCRNTD